jgi:hypothetical protein
MASNGQSNVIPVAFNLARSRLQASTIPGKETIKAMMPQTSRRDDEYRSRMFAHALVRVCRGACDERRVDGRDPDQHPLNHRTTTPLNRLHSSGPLPRIYGDSRIAVSESSSGTGIGGRNGSSGDGGRSAAADD